MEERTPSLVIIRSNGRGSYQKALHHKNWGLTIRTWAKASAAPRRFRGGQIPRWPVAPRMKHARPRSLRSGRIPRWPVAPRMKHARLRGQYTPVFRGGPRCPCEEVLVAAFLRTAGRKSFSLVPTTFVKTPRSFEKKLGCGSIFETAAWSKTERCCTNVGRAATSTRRTARASVAIRSIT